MQAQIFLGIGFTNWNVIEKYFRMNFLSSLSAKNDLMSLLCRVRVELFISSRSLLRLLAVLSGTLTVENSQRLSDKLLMYIRNKSGPNIDH